MRLTDLLHPHLDGVTTVVDAAGRGLRLAPYLHLPDGVRLLHDDGERPVQQGELVLLSYGPDPALHGTEEDCLAVLERIRPGGRGLLLFGHPGPEPPYHRLLDGLVAQRCQVLRAAPLDYVHLRAGAVFTRLTTDELLPPHDWFGHAVPSDGFTTMLRMTGEYVLADLVSRSLRARHLDLERRAEEAERARDDVREDGLADRLAATVREKEQLASALRGARSRVEVLQARVAMLEGSTSLKVGRALVSAARSPRHRVPGLPRELYGLWRGRAAKKAAPASRSAAAQAAPVTADERLHLVHRAFSSAPRDRLVIAGLLTDRTAEDFAADAVVNRPLPHDGALLVRRTDPDAVVVQLSACTGDGPWSLAGTGMAPDLDRRLAELLTEARATGRAAVLWRDAPPSAAPGLAQLAWDAVLDADTGVRLSRLDPAGDGRERLREAFQWDSTRVRLAELARLVGAPDPLDGRRVAVLAAPRDRHDVARLVAQVLGQQHRPAEVVVPDPAGLDELDAAGVAVRTGPPTAAWVADWTDLAEDRADTLLLDLMCAQEYSGADALGHAAAGEDYTFVPALRRPLLVRRSLHLAGAPPESWCARGHRLFAVRGKEPS
ncbi:hypothetical protein JK361_01415 [Streptomyces sp. 5-8]|uniref:Uncharacterized protein n=1 Tax=Streptomyces musisoli TaxID=2802280 RepID=A0ABS1NT68_9ACTN|nr:MULTISPECIES: hypothetical protein [Streptomyces]MBL1103278.1 hypothetical protein [Streptomyces musisoli]MBY8845800.1 hypothetical protein [Streptomyces sp. SP2-10]